MSKHVTVKTSRGNKTLTIKRSKIDTVSIGGEVARSRTYTIFDQAKNLIAIVRATSHNGKMTVSARLTDGTADAFDYRKAKTIHGKDHNAVFAKIIKKTARRAA